MRSFYATSLMVLSANAVKLNPADRDVSPNYTDWFEHPSYMDAQYADYYGRDTSNAVNAAEVAKVDYLVENPKQYWVENWYKDSSMPIAPKVKWDNPRGLTNAQRAWRKNAWVDESATKTNQQPGLLKGEYKNLLRELQDIERNNVKSGNRVYTGNLAKLKSFIKTLEEVNEDAEEEEDEQNIQVDDEQEDLE